MPAALSQPELFALVADGATVVLPHAHAAHTLRSRFGQHIASSPPSPEGPEPGTILAWHEWASSLWSQLLVEGADERVLLNRAQEHQLWADILSSRTGAVAGLTGTSPSQVSLLRSGLRLAAAYNAVDRLRTAADGPDTRLFANAVSSFQDYCNRHRLLSGALLDQALTHHLRGRALSALPRVHVVGFERFTPAQRDLLAAVQASGTVLQTAELRSASAPTQPLAITTADPREQLQFAVRWIADRARQHPGTFALITPQPDLHRQELERLLREALAPELEPVTADLSSTPWQFSASPPLRTSAVVSDAMVVLSWLVEPLALDRIEQLLVSPYLAFADTPESRARVGSALLRKLAVVRPELGLGEFIGVVESSSRGPHLPQLRELRSLQRLAEQRALPTASRPHAEWADLVRSLLREVGWPGTRSLTALEFAAVQAWDGALDLLATLDLNGRRLTFRTFLHKLQDEAGQASLPNPGPAAPLQILTLPEAEAIPFDHVLVLDATDTELPAPAKAHPLLPRRLQRALNMPGADPSQAYRLARAQLGALRQRSATLHLLAPTHDANGELRMTRLAQDLQFVPVHASDVLPPTSPFDPIDLGEAPLESPLPPLPSPEVRGGARVLELQSGCGFHAFAELRLRADAPSSAQLGLDPREAGSRLHQALQHLWHNLKDQATLRAMPTAEREAQVLAAVQRALAPLGRAPGASQPWSHAFLELLESRFTHILIQWLEMELKRAPFSTLAQEEGRRIRLGPLELNVRPDRIDEVDAGLVFIDYKTSYSLSTDDWLGPRPEAPQVPLYTLLADPEQIRGLAFARVRTGRDMGWLSFSNGPATFPQDNKNTQRDLALHAELWREELTALAQAFADGDASVDPKSYPKTCQYCAHRLLCRLDPATLLAQVDEDAPEEEQDEEEVLG